MKTHKSKSHRQAVSLSGSQLIGLSQAPSVRDVRSRAAANSTCAGPSLRHPSAGQKMS
jgi:hypothetical protein